MTLGSTRVSRIAAGLWLAALVLLAGCGPKPTLEPPVPVRDPCALGPEAPLEGMVISEREIRVGVTEEVDLTHAPVPANDAERFVFRQCYETLVNVDCAGRVRPGLAETWESSEGGRVWTFTLRPEARFWGGDQATAPAVAKDWPVRRAGNESPALSWIDVESVVAVESRRLRVRLTEEGLRVGSVRVFAHPALAVARARGSGSAPAGTGPRELAPAGDGELELAWSAVAGDGPIPARKGSGDPAPPLRRPALRVMVFPGADPRDLLAQGADLVVARARNFTDYAEQLPDFGVYPLPWDRVYLLLAPRGPGRTGPMPPAGAGDAAVLNRLRDDLASQGCASDARPAHGLSFDTSLSRSCDRLAPPARESVLPPARARIVHPAGDADADQLAQRVTGLAIMKSEQLQRALPLSMLVTADDAPHTQALGASDLRDALRREDSYGYVLPVRREAFDQCALLSALRIRIPWVEAGPEGRGANLFPLVVTRPVVAVRRGLAGLAVDGDGTVLMRDAGWAASELTP